MPHYRFQIDDGAGYDAGVITHLPSLGDAKLEAARAIGEIAHMDTARFLAAERCSIRVSDGAGLILFEIMVLVTNSPALKSPKSQD